MNILIGVLLITASLTYNNADQSAILRNLKDTMLNSSVLTTPCFIKLLQKYIHADDDVVKRSTAIISQMINTKFQQRYLLKAIHQSEELSILMKKPNTYHYSAERMKEKSKVYVTFVSDATELIQHLSLIKRLPTYNTYAKIIVCFPDMMTTGEFELQRKQSMEILFENDFFDIFVIGVKYNTVILESYTTFPYDNGNCAKKVNAIQLVDECEYKMDNIDFTSETMKNIFEGNINSSNVRLIEYRKFYPKLPDKIPGCIVPVTVSNFEPYVVIDRQRNRVAKGIEVMMLNTTFKAIEASVKFNIQDPKARYYRTSLDNKTGVFADIINEKSIFLSGGFKADMRLNRSVQSTIPYAYDDVTWCVHVADLAPAWLNTFKTYNGELWLAVGISISTCGILLFYFIKFEQESRHYNLAWSCLSIFGTFISMFTVKYDPKMIFIRIFMTALLFAGINLWVAYTSSLISILTLPRHNKQVSSVPDAIESGMIFYGSINYLDFIIENKLQEPGYLELVQRFRVCESASQCFESFSKDKNSVIATSRIQALHNKQALSIEKFCFDEENNLFEYSVSTLSYPYHHLLPHFNKMIGHILQSGLMVKWAQDVDKEKTGTPANPEIKLSLYHLEGVFVMLGIGTLLAIIAFVIEWLYFIHKNGKEAAKQKVCQIFESFQFKT